MDIPDIGLPKRYIDPLTTLTMITEINDKNQNRILQNTSVAYIVHWTAHCKSKLQILSVCFLFLVSKNEMIQIYLRLA